CGNVRTYHTQSTAREPGPPLRGISAQPPATVQYRTVPRCRNGQGFGRGKGACVSQVGPHPFLVDGQKDRGKAFQCKCRAGSREASISLGVQAPALPHTGRWIL